MCVCVALPSGAQRQESLAALQGQNCGHPPTPVPAYSKCSGPAVWEPGCERTLILTPEGVRNHNPCVDLALSVLFPWKMTHGKSVQMGVCHTPLRLFSHRVLILKYLGDLLQVVLCSYRALPKQGPEHLCPFVLSWRMFLARDRPTPSRLKEFCPIQGFGIKYKV